MSSIERNLFAEVAKRDPQFRKIAHFNRIKEINSERSRECGVRVDPDEYKLLGCDVVEHTDQELVDQQIDFDYIKQFGNCWRDDYSSLRNLLRQFYSLNSVTELLLREKSRPDLVIFSRADLRFKCPVEIPQIRPRTLYTAWFERYHGLNDRFGIGDFETMVAYGRRQSMVRAYCEEKNQPLGAEHYLFWYMRKMGFQNRHLTSMNFSRVRADGAERAVRDDAREKTKFYFKRGLERVGMRRF